MIPAVISEESIHREPALQNERFIVSFPHQTKELGTLLLIDQEATTEDRFKWIGQNLDNAASYGLEGLGDYFFHGYNNEAGSWINIFDKKKLELVDSYKLEQVKDAHSICTFAGDLVVVATGTDEVYRISINDFKEAEVIYKASLTGRDMHHLNSITVHDGKLFISGFGVRSDLSWHSAKNGYIKDIIEDEEIARGLYHPHSLFSYMGRLLVCESSRSQVLDVNTGRTVFQGTGYIRGLTVDSNANLIIGQSKGRAHSGQPGIVRNMDDRGDIVGTASVYRYNCAQSSIESTWDLTDYGPELYEIITI